MKLAISLILVLFLVFTGAPRFFGVHAEGAHPSTLWEAMECCIDDRIIAAMALAFQPSSYHHCPVPYLLPYGSTEGINSNKADVKIYKRHSAFLI
jgi:hypothetical protein